MERDPERNSVTEVEEQKSDVSPLTCAFLAQQFQTRFLAPRIEDSSLHGRCQVSAPPPHPRAFTNLPLLTTLL